MRSPRSVAEILPASFEHLTLDDVRSLLASMGDEPETMYVERKGDVHATGLAKACAAFANTYGGLLIGGVEDGSGKLVGMPAPGGEVAMWVKNVLRDRILPLPPFRARWVPLAKKRGADGVLLVLVEESSTTPHLDRTRGAIYVRAPGSSEPVPISDQTRLIELTRRGAEARERAVRMSDDVTAHVFASPTLYRVGIAPTGAMTDPVADLHTRRAEWSHVDELAESLRGERETNYQTVAGHTQWALHSLHHIVQRFPPERSMQWIGFTDGVVLTSECSLGLSRGLVSRATEPVEPRGPRPVDLRYDVLPWLRAAIANGLLTISALGGHGDAHIQVTLELHGRSVTYADQRGEQAKGDTTLRKWAPVEADEAFMERLLEEMWSDILRALGLPPQVLAAHPAPRAGQ